MVTLQPLTVPFWPLLMDNTSLIHLLKEKSGKLNWIYCNRVCFSARFRLLQKNTLFKRGKRPMAKSEEYSQSQETGGDRRDSAWCSREQTWREAGRASLQGSAPVTPSVSCGQEERGTGNLHKDWTEVSSSRNLSAILTLETAPGNAATSGSPPCCDIVVAHIFGPCRLYCPHIPFPLWLLLPAFASSWTDLRLSSLCPTSGGVDCWALIVLDSKTLLESSSDFYIS